MEKFIVEVPTEPLVEYIFSRNVLMVQKQTQ